MPLDKSTTRIREMFGQIAGRYDFLNRLLSLGIDRSWRRKTVKLVPPEGDAPILDVCTGTADLALAYWRASIRQAKGTEEVFAKSLSHDGKPIAKTSSVPLPPVVGTDFCLPMLEIGREKCRRAGASPRSNAPRGNAQPDAPRPSDESTQSVGPHVPTQSVGTRSVFPTGVTLLEADTLHLPFPDDMFQIVCVAFGLRNVSDTDAGLREMARVCRPGGRVAILEFSTPTAWPLGAIYGWYFRNVLPRIGQALARNSQAAYNYLPQSVGNFPQGEALAERMRAAGLAEVWFKPFTFGVATLYYGKKV